LCYANTSLQEQRLTAQLDKNQNLNLTKPQKGFFAMPVVAIFAAVD
jgi:hypothetical protein